MTTARATFNIVLDAVGIVVILGGIVLLGWFAFQVISHAIHGSAITPSEAGVLLKDHVVPACHSKSKFERLQELAINGEAYTTAVGQALVAGECTLLPAQTQVFVEETSRFADAMRVRAKGSQESLWISHTRFVKVSD
jgi:hypothetical protein